MLLVLLACRPGDSPPETTDKSTITTTTTTATTSSTITTPTSCDAPVSATSLTAEAHGIENDRLVKLDLDAPSPAALLCAARDDASDRFLLESPNKQHHEFRLQGLRNDTTYDCSGGPTCPAGNAQALQIDVGPMATEFAPTITSTGTPPLGWLLIGVETVGCIGPGAPAIFDPEGRLRWYYFVDRIGMDYETTWLGDGTLWYGGHTEGPGPVRVDLWDGLIQQTDLPGDAVFHHDTQVLDDGRLLVLEERANHDGDLDFTGFGLRAYDPVTGEVSWDWDSQQAVDAGTLASGTGDYYHANWIWWVDHGQGPKVYVSLCNRSTILRIDQATGAVDWDFRGDFSLFDPSGNALDDDEFTECQHGMDVSADGTKLLAYDNGRFDLQSRVVEYELDSDARTAVETRQWTDGWYEWLLGDADWLADGTVLVTAAHSECYTPERDASEVIQIDLDSGEELWRLRFDQEDMATYRSTLLDGCAWFSNVGQCPALQARWDELAPAFGR
jgi:hypothetical protein